MKIKQRNLNLLRMLVYCTELRDVVMMEFEAQTRRWFGNRAHLNSRNGGNANLFNDEFEDELYQNVWAAVGEDELENHESNLGQWADLALVSNRSPFAYRLVRTQQHPILELCEMEADVVRLIFDWYVVQNFTLREMAQHLTQMQLPTPADVWMQNKKKNGRAVWHAATIRAILISKTYTGRWQYLDPLSGKEVACLVPAIISDETFEQAQEKLRANRNTPRHALKFDYLLAGRVYCEACGSPVRLLGSRTSSGKVYQYYRCPTQSCKTRGFQSQEVDQITWAWLKATLYKQDPHLQQLKASHQMQIQMQLQDLLERLRLVDQFRAHYAEKLGRLSDVQLPADFLKSERAYYHAYLFDAVTQLQSSGDELRQWLAELTSSPALSLDIADNDLVVQQKCIELLDVQVKIRGRNRERFMKISSGLGEMEMQLPEKADE
ncbi:MAG: recombinase family protein [Anaerolineae bacterium]|nr:recombinase family protein [Anaerolineae bacterium]